MSILIVDLSCLRVPLAMDHEVPGAYWPDDSCPDGEAGPQAASLQAASLQHGSAA